MFSISPRASIAFTPFQTNTLICAPTPKRFFTPKYITHFRYTILTLTYDIMIQSPPTSFNTRIDTLLKYPNTPYSLNLNTNVVQTRNARDYLSIYICINASPQKTKSFNAGAEKVLGTTWLYYTRSSCMRMQRNIHIYTHIQSPPSQNHM